MSVATLNPDFTSIKQRQQAVWSAGDYAIIGTTLQIVGERLCEVMLDMRAGSNVLHVAAGNGNATLAAARRFARVTSTDYVGALLDRGKERAAAERLAVTFQEADAEALPFAEGTFDVALSTFGVMFTPNQEKAAAELIRVVHGGGRIGLANWTPDGFIGQLLKIVGKHMPPPAGLKPPSSGGTEPRLRELFAGHEIDISPMSSPSIGSTCFGHITVRSIGRSHRSMQRNNQRWKPISWICSTSPSGAAAVRSSSQENISRW